eukprot:5286266-Amphidinium_carterae.2
MSRYHTSTPEIKRVYDGFENEDYVEEMNRRRQEIQQRGREGEELEGCVNTTTLLQCLLTMSSHYAPDFFETITTQKRDDLREQNWSEEQVRERELDLQGQQLLEHYAILPQKALDMWIMCGRVPASYLQDPTDPLHRFYNFHKEVHYAITDYINLYSYNMPNDFPRTAQQFTHQDYYFVVIHTTEGLLRDMKSDIEHTAQRSDMTRWYSRKEQDQ